jgi:hypothetical protein
MPNCEDVRHIRTAFSFACLALAVLLTLPPTTFALRTVALRIRCRLYRGAKRRVEDLN